MFQAQDDSLNATKAKTSQQTLLICIPSDGNLNSGKFFIRADSYLIDVPRDFLKAFDVLLKLHFSFDVAVRSNLKTVYVR